MKEFLTPGEKIKMLRTNIGLKQEDLTSETVSKSLISMIEMGKRALTPPVAAVIADSLNYHYKKMGKYITPEYLLEDRKVQISKEIAMNLDTLKKGVNSSKADIELLKNTFDKVINLIGMGDFPEELMEMKIVRGNFYYDNYQYKEAVQDYLDVLDHSMRVGDYEQVARAYNLLGRTYQMQLVIDNAIAHYAKAYDTALMHNTPNQNEIKVQSMLNQILCYRILKRYDVALDHIDIFKKRLHWDDPLFKVYSNRVLLIEANTYRDLENYYSAEQIYKALLAEAKKLDDETLFLLYENYGVYQRNLGNKKNAMEYFDKAYEMKGKVSLNYLPGLYLYQSTCYNLDEEFEMMLDRLEEGLKLASMVSKKHMIVEIRFACVEVHMRLQDYEGALLQLQQVEKILENTVAKSLFNDMYSYCVEIYNELGDTKKSIEYLKKIRQKSYLGY